jgi:hypothetical protein
MLWKMAAIQIFAYLGKVMVPKMIDLREIIKGLQGNRIFGSP